MEPKCSRILLFFIFLIVTGSSLAQVTIWEEDFESYADGITSGTGTGANPANWSTNNANIDVLTVSGNKVLNGSDTSTTSTWTTSPIDISGYTNVQFSLDVTSGGGLDSGIDVFRIQYRIDGGTYVEIENTSGDTSPSEPIDPSYSVTGLSGNTLEFRITMYNTFSGEYYRIDNVLVQGTTGCETRTSSPGTFITNGAPVSETLTGFATGTITDVNVTLNIAHTYDEDLNISLTSPDGTTIDLSSGNGGQFNNYTNTVFDDDAGTAITAGSAPFTGSFRPEGSLSSFNGEEASGTWTLTIVDTFNQDDGTLNNFSIEVCTAAVPTTPVLTIDDVTVNEGDGNAVFTVTHTGGSTSGPFNVNYTTNNSTAVAGDDYSAAVGTLNFTGTSGDTETITISIIDDLDDEPNETYTIGFTGTTDNSVDITDTAIGTITDDDDPRVLTVEDIAVNEGDGTAVFTVTHSGPNASGPFTVDFTVNNGTATFGTDFSPNSGSLSFSGTSGDTENITITIIDDTDVESLIEDYSVALSNPSDASFDTSDTANGTIRDNDAILVTDGGTVNTCGDTLLDDGGINGNYSNNQNNFIVICPDAPGKDVELSFSSFALENNFDFLMVYDGNSGDASGTLLGQFTGSSLPPNIKSSDASGCLTIRFFADNIINAAGVEANITCVDKTPELSIADVSVNEGDGTATFTVTHTGIDTAGPFNITYETVDGTATAGLDYTAISNGTLSFNGTVGDTETITINIIDDTRTESQENFTIRFLTSPDDPTVDISDTAIGTINDNEVILNDVPLSLYDDLSGKYDYAVTGGSLRTLANDPGDTSAACAITTSSSGVLTSTIAPAGKKVERAYLYWSHSSFDVDQDVTLEGTPVSADLVYGATFSGLQYYGYIADVTDLIDGITDPWSETYDFSGLTIDNTGSYCTGQTVLGAWSLMIFYEDLALPSSTINLYYGFDVTQNAGTSFTLDNFFAISPTGSKATFLSYEGDDTLDGNTGNAGEREELSITTQGGVTTILTGDGAQTGNNPYNSTLYDEFSGTNITTTYGLDLDTYDISSFINTSDTQITANVNARQDLILSSAVVLRVPSNVISGIVFEDINYPGGLGRTQTASTGIGIENTTLELYNSVGTLLDTETTDENGEYTFGGMSDGNYTVRVVNATVNSTRGGGDTCPTCFAIQTFRSDYDGTTFTNILDEVGGAFPSAEDAGAGTLAGAQTTSSVIISAGGTGNVDFGFNFNTIVNTNENGQGSLEQFIINANNLDETGLDIGSNGIFDPAAGEDTSIFMIPPTSDSQGRIADTNFTSGYFDIFISDVNPLSSITAANTVIDGRTQTAYSGDTNTGTVGSGGTTVGVSGSVLPNYELPEIQVHINAGDVFKIEGDNTVVRNLAVYANNNAGIRIDDGDNITIRNSLLGVNAAGVNAGDIDHGIEIVGTTSGNLFINGNYISSTTTSGIFINGGAGSKTIENNHIFAIGDSPCDRGIDIRNGSSGVIIRQNLIENTASVGIDNTGLGDIAITENSITGSGQDGGDCSGNVENFGVRLSGSNSDINNNIIFDNGGTGLVLVGSATDTGNLISQNSIYGNGTASAALGIDIVATGVIPDGVTLNDTGDTDTGPNTLINFPVFSGINQSGTNMIVSGWAESGAIIEFFLTDINQGTAAAGDNTLGLSTDYGEGQIYLGTFVEGSIDDTDSGVSFYNDLDGNTGNTNRFRFSIPMGMGSTLGSSITATATIANSTSEFSPVSLIKAYTVITNRRITYRVKKD
ncbi:beta strand repeat-containing protein [Maribacter sp. 2210JD10-5]|uniref:beta strand repeat-containing protein n=1 Tax=Maribacter sp. 2210JD10-5 TaxID=3386272 RepID=UPI0039BD04A2